MKEKLNKLNALSAEIIDLRILAGECQIDGC